MQLARDCAAGQASAQENLFTLYRGTVFGICLQILKNPELAEDLTQEIFIHIFRKIHSFHGAARLKTWIYRLSVNQCLMYLRKNKKTPPIAALDEKEFCLPVRGSENPRLPNIDAKILLEKCIGQIPPGQKKILILYDIEGFNHTEIARILNLSEGTVKSQLFKARQKMRKLMNRKCNPKMFSAAGL